MHKHRKKQLIIMSKTDVFDIMIIAQCSVLIRFYQKYQIHHIISKVENV